MNKYAFIVLGVARSGTSALAGCLSHLGVEFGQGLKPVDWQNPKGNFENKALSQANQRLLALLGSNWSDHKSLPEGWRSFADVSKEDGIIENIIRKVFSEHSPIGLKDPRLVPLLPLYMDLLKRLGYIPVLISTTRNKHEVIESIGKSGYYHGEYSP
ncbi:MAG: hypothetical protein V3V22_01780 [Methylococcales bacterium]